MHLTFFVLQALEMSIYSYFINKKRGFQELGPVAQPRSCKGGIGSLYDCRASSRVASTGARGAEFPLTAKNLPKIGQKRGKSAQNREKEEKSGRKGKNREGSFTLPLLTDWAGYASACNAIATAAILSVTHGGWVIISLDCFSANYTCWAFTVW